MNKDPGPSTVVDLPGLAHPAVRRPGRPGADRVPPRSLGRAALAPRDPEAGYDDLHQRYGSDLDISEGLPEEDPAWVRKVHEASGARSASSGGV
ncbi:hypothetical protein [Streptomyces canus]|uniref:hypothetical protein n=1 Tax=Streptomyces canus TaxID=58343 RepID=UPI003CE69695